MTAELEENKRNIEAAQNDLQFTNVELDERRRYIETILQTIATGVISLDTNYRIQTMNPAAVQMLGSQSPTQELLLDQLITGPACDALRMMLHKSAVLGTVVRNIELNLPGKSLHLATTVTPLADASGQRTGWVLVLDDLTELLRVEKMAAWQEVARRLAHEIKNPLTPIQLSAERVLNRYRQIKPMVRNIEEPLESGKGDFSSFESLLQECVRTITQEASSLKKLVDEFTRFARLPEIRPEETDLHQVLDSALSLHNGRIQEVRIDKDFDSQVPNLNLDPGQMKRVFINLFDNALEAMAGISHHKVLQIRTSRNRQSPSVTVEVSDTGRGFPEEYQDSLFLPYFSTRKGGTGLGLAIVRQIVMDHHGRVRAEPNLPMGTKIIIDLPLAAS
jgi:PAS domain S-box-containing protein